MKASRTVQRPPRSPHDAPQRAQDAPGIPKNAPPPRRWKPAPPSKKVPGFPRNSQGASPEAPGNPKRPPKCQRRFYKFSERPAPKGPPKIPQEAFGPRPRRGESKADGLTPRCALRLGCDGRRAIIRIVVIVTKGSHGTFTWDHKVYAVSLRRMLSDRTGAF